MLQQSSDERPDADLWSATAAASPMDVLSMMVPSLAVMDGSGVSDDERLALVAELERVKAAASAAQARVTDAFTRSRQASGAEPRSVGSQVALARREAPSKGDRFVGLARALVAELPGTLAALSRGETNEWRVTVVARETATLSPEDRAVADARLAPLLGTLGDRATGDAARRLTQELDAAAVVARMERAVRSRRVSVRPAPDGMAYLTVLGPLVQVVGAFAVLRAHAEAVTTGAAQVPDSDGRVDQPAGRSRSHVMADAALRWLSGRGIGEAQPVEVGLVMTDTALFAAGDAPATAAPAFGAPAADDASAGDRRPQTTDRTRYSHEPVRVIGHGTIPAALARAMIHDEDPQHSGTGASGPATDAMGADAAGAGTAGVDTDRRRARVWLRRLYTRPDGRDLVAMDSRRRVFTGQLRRLLVLRDDTCRTPWCDAPIRDVDHTLAHRDGGATSVANGGGLCQRCNLTKELPGWTARITATGLGQATGSDQGSGDLRGQRARGERPRSHTIEMTTPTGQTYRSTAPPILGWGWTSPGEPDAGAGEPDAAEDAIVDGQSADPLSGRTLSGRTLSGRTLSGRTLSGRTLSGRTPGDLWTRRERRERTGLTVTRMTFADLARVS